MNWPLITNPAMLGGLVLLSVPVLIHLLLRIKRKRLRFSTLRFFRRQDEQATRRRKVRNRLLLATRILLYLVIVLAFARPYLTPLPAAAKSQPRRQFILVLDRSASMGAMDPEGPRWERAKAAIHRLLSSLGSEDRAALISCAALAEVLAEPTAAGDILTMLDTLMPTQATADLGQGLRHASRLIANTSRYYTNTIYVVSDLQRASCANLGSYPIPRETNLQVLNIGDLFAPNVAITQLQLHPGRDPKPNVTVVNFSEDNVGNFTLQLLVDGKEISSTQLHLAGGGSTNVELAMPQPVPGWHSPQVRIEPEDALALDDTRYQTVYVPPPVRVLVVEPRRVPQLYREESFFILSALDPAFGLTNQSNSPFALEKISPEDLVGRLQIHHSPWPCDIAVVPGLKSIPAGLGRALTGFVRAGGGLLLFLNDDLSVNRYNTELAGLLPVQLETMETASDLDWRLWDYEEQSAVFTPFVAPHSGNLALARFTRRAALHAMENAGVLARFQDGVPLIMERLVGQGRVMLVNTSADCSWSDWPKHKTYVPWMHSILRFLANRGHSEKPDAGKPMLAGTDRELDLGPGYKNRPLTLLRPDGTETDCATDAQGWLQDLHLETCGVYSLRESPGREVCRWPVNVPVAESDLVAMTPAEFERQVARAEPTEKLSLAANWFGSRNDRQEFWRMLLLTGLILLLLEPFLANRTLA